MLAVEDRTAELFAEEAALVGGAAPRRLATFSSGRAAARAALAAAGAPGGRPILAEGRAPAAPEGWRLSISHTDEIAVAVACPAGRAEGLGVDLERLDRMDPAYARRIVGPADRFPEGFGVRELTLAFSLRESLFKALSGDEQRALSRIDLSWPDEPGAEEQVVAALVPGPPAGLDIRHAVCAGHALTLARRTR